MIDKRIGTPDCAYMKKMSGFFICTTKCVPCKIRYGGECDQKDREEHLMNTLKALVNGIDEDKKNDGR